MRRWIGKDKEEIDSPFLSLISSLAQCISLSHLSFYLHPNLLIQSLVVSFKGTTGAGNEEMQGLKSNGGTLGLLVGFPVLAGAQQGMRHGMSPRETTHWWCPFSFTPGDNGNEKWSDPEKNHSTELASFLPQSQKWCTPCLIPCLLHQQVVSVRERAARNTARLCHRMFVVNFGVPFETYQKRGTNSKKIDQHNMGLKENHLDTSPIGSLHYLRRQMRDRRSRNQIHLIF